MAPLTVDTPGERYERLLAELEPRCQACGSALQIERRAGFTDCYNEALFSLSGGYGSFTDDLVQGPYELIICEACAMKVARVLNLDAAIRQHHTSTVCACSDAPPKKADGWPAQCLCAACRRARRTDPA